MKKYVQRQLENPQIKRKIMRQVLKLLVLIGIWSLGSAASVFAQSFEFKGIVLGSKVNIKDLQGQHHLTCTENPARALSTVLCSDRKTTFLGMDAFLYVTVTDVVEGQGVVYAIKVNYNTTTVSPKDVAAELSKKFGPPKKQRASVIFDWENSQGYFVHLEHREIIMRLPRKHQKVEPPRLNRKDL